MKNIKHWSAILCLFLLIAACKPGDFGDTNVNPNALEIPIPSALLTYSLIQTANGSLDMTCGLYCQFFSESSYTDRSRYTFFDREWAFLYAGPLYDLQLIIQLNSDPETAGDFIQYGSNANQIATAKILLAYNFSKLTDLYGDIPYSKALLLQPKIPYDTQEEIYKGLLITLKEAVLQFDNGIGPTGDILFNGDVAKWKKFANSLRLILAMRMSEAAPALAKAEFLAALNDPAGTIETNADNVEQPYIGGLYRNPWFNLYSGGKFYSVSRQLTDTLMSLGDPRLFVFGQPNSMGQVIGIPYGLERDSAITYTSAHPEWPFILKSTFRSATSSVYILTAASTLLARAEAAQLGWTAEDANSLYSDGLQASFEQWGVYQDSTFMAYMMGNQVSLATEALKKIRLQRYLSFYPDGLQAYSEWRRTAVPDLQPTPFAVNASKQIPRRFAYPVSEQNLNADAWKAAVDKMGSVDSPDQRVWWDK